MKITYDDKVSLSTSPLPRQNKCTAEDLNQIKEVVNTNADTMEQNVSDITTINEWIDTLRLRIQDILDAIQGTILFDNASGSQANVNLSDSAANYDFIDVIYGKSASAGYSSVRIYDPNNKTIVLTSSSGTTNNSITIYNSTFLINGNRLVVQNGKSIAFSNTGDVQGFATSAELRIYKVVGYKY